jgi:hypothetical protein
MGRLPPCQGDCRRAEPAADEGIFSADLALSSSAVRRRRTSSGSGSVLRRGACMRSSPGPNRLPCAGEWPNRSVWFVMRFWPCRVEAKRFARERLAKRRFENAIGPGEEINQLGDAPTDIAQLAYEGEVRRQAGPRLEPARQDAIVADREVPYRWRQPGYPAAAIGAEGDGVIGVVDRCYGPRG